MRPCEHVDALRPRPDACRRTPVQPGRRCRQRRRVPVVWVAALLAVGLRLPLLSRPPSPDEAGFLLVGGQWHSGGTSLYGNYWVDRPPLLITIFRVAADAGGLVPLRLIGCLATVLVVLGAAHVARLLGGRRAAGGRRCGAAAAARQPADRLPVRQRRAARRARSWSGVSRPMVRALRGRRHALRSLAGSCGRRPRVLGDGQAELRRRRRVRRGRRLLAGPVAQVS